MILVFVTNKRIGEVRYLPFEERVSYQNPKYFKKSQHPLKCNSVYIHGDYPEIAKCYEGKVINFDSKALKSSKDYTIAELRELKPSIEDWDSFTEGDNRKSIHKI